MNKPTKWVLKIIGVIFAILLVVLIAFITVGGSIIKGTVNGVGPKMLGVKVHVDSVGFHPLFGKVGLKGLTVGNPEGFDAETNLFSLDEVGIHLDISSLSGTGPIIIHEVLVDNIGVFYERLGGQSNLDALLKNIGTEEKKEKAEEKKKDDKPARDVIIEKMIFKGGKLSGQVTLPVVNTPLRLNLPLPAITLNDLGKSEPTTIETVIEAVVTAINDQIIPMVQQAITSGAAAATDAVKAVGGAASDAAKSAAGAVGDAAGAVGDAAGGAVKAIGNLFGGSDADKK